MTDENKELNRGAIKRILEAKSSIETKTRQPEYQRLDLEPKSGGRSLLHDEFGLPKVSSKQEKKAASIEEISSEPVIVKASTPSAKISYMKAPSRIVIKDAVDDDKFVPPKSNFVSVGHVEHAWYDDKVTGHSTIDNNYYIGNSADATDKLQGRDPLEDVKDPKVAEAYRYFEKRLRHVKNLVITQLSEVTEIFEIENLRENTFGDNGIFTDIVRKLDTLKLNGSAVGELVSQVYSELDLEIEGKTFELSEDEEPDESEEWPADMAQITNGRDDSDEVDEEDTETGEEDSGGSDVVLSIPEGSYAIILDDKLFEEVSNITSVRISLSQLILNMNVDLSRIKLIKRIPIDFGIVLGE
jgi:hypothetical protein